MKFEIEVVSFNVKDVITASACDDPRPAALGGDIVPSCPTQM